MVKQEAGGPGGIHGNCSGHPHPTAHGHSRHDDAQHHHDHAVETAVDPVLGTMSRQRAPAAVSEGTIYTCPMHPQIRQVGPGNCPICGMALEPELAAADSGPNPELIDMTRRFWVGLALSIPVVVLEMGGHLVGGHGWIDQSLSNWIQFVLATPAVIWAGWPFFVRGW